MSKTLISMTSITYAMKAKNILNQKRISCVVEKTPKNVGTGCGYTIYIKDNKDKIISILEKNNIPHNGVYEI